MRIKIHWAIRALLRASATMALIETGADLLRAVEPYGPVEAAALLFIFAVSLAALDATEDRR